MCKVFAEKRIKSKQWKSNSYLFRGYLYLYIIRLGKVLLIFCDSEAGKCFTV